MCEHLAGCPPSHNHLPSWEREELPNIPTQTMQSLPPVNVSLPSATRDFPARRVLAPVPQAPTPAPSSEPSRAGIHTNPPASFFPYRNGNPLLMQREVWAEAGRWHTPAQLPAPPNPPGEQKEEEGGLPFEGRLCLVCRDEKVPMTAPMAAKTCVRLGTPGPAPPLPWEETSVERPLRIGGGQGARQLSCSSLVREPGAGAPGTLPFLLQPCTCTDSQGQWPASPRSRARPLPSPRAAADGASEPAWR